MFSRLRRQLACGIAVACLKLPVAADDSRPASTDALSKMKVGHDSWLTSRSWRQFSAALLTLVAAEWSTLDDPSATFATLDPSPRSGQCWHVFQTDEGMRRALALAPTFASHTPRMMFGDWLAGGHEMAEQCRSSGE